MEVGQEREGEVIAEVFGRSVGSSGEDIVLAEGRAVVDGDRVIDGGASEAARGVESGGGSTEGLGVKVAKADANSAEGRGPYRSEFIGECGAKGVVGDGGTHFGNVREQLHQDRAVMKGDTPRVRVPNVYHRTHHCLGFERALSQSALGVGNTLQLLLCGDAACNDTPVCELGCEVGLDRV